jgi:hypothetical protein
MGVIISIRVICGFLAGLAAGILIMRVMYKGKGAAAEATGENPETAISAKVS